MRNKAKIILSWSLVLLWMVVIFRLSSQVAVESDSLSLGITQIIINAMEKVFPGFEAGALISNHIIRKSAHFFAYLLLGILAMNALLRSKVRGVKAIGIALGICVLYAISDEIHQLFVPGRSGQVKDVIIDSAGAITGLGLYKLISRFLIGRARGK